MWGRCIEFGAGIADCNDRLIDVKGTGFGPVDEGVGRFAQATAADSINENSDIYCAAFCIISGVDQFLK